MERQESAIRAICNHIGECYLQERPLTHDVDMSWYPYKDLLSRVHHHMLETYPESYVDLRKLMCYLDYLYEANEKQQ